MTCCPCSVFLCVMNQRLWCSLCRDLEILSYGTPSLLLTRQKLLQEAHQALDPTLTDVTVADWWLVTLPKRPRKRSQPWSTLPVCPYQTTILSVRPHLLTTSTPPPAFTVPCHHAHYTHLRTKSTDYTLSLKRCYFTTFHYFSVYARRCVLSPQSLVRPVTRPATATMRPLLAT